MALNDARRRPIRVSFTWSRVILRVFGIAYDIDAPVLDGHPWKSRFYDAFSICVMSTFGTFTAMICVSVYNSFGNFQRQLNGVYALIHALAKFTYVLLFFANRKKFYALVSKANSVYPNQILVKYNFKMDFKVYRTLGLAFIILGSIACLQWAFTPLVVNKDVEKSHLETSPIFGINYPFDADLHPRMKQLFDMYEMAVLFYDSAIGFAFYGTLYSLIAHLCAGIQSLNEGLAKVDCPKRKLVPKKRNFDKRSLTIVKSLTAMSYSFKTDTDLSLEKLAEYNIVVDPIVHAIQTDLHAEEANGTVDSKNGNELLETLVAEEDETDEEEAMEVNHLLVERALLGCIAQHQAIVKFAVELSHLFRPILLIQSCVFKLAFSILAIQIVVHNHDLEKELKFYSTLVVYSIMLYMYCWIGDTLGEKSSEICDVAYACNWHDWSITAKSNLRLLMLRSQRPLQLMAGKLFPISLHMFIAIINTSYSIFDILRHLNDRYKIYNGDNY